MAKEKTWEEINSSLTRDIVKMLKLPNPKLTTKYLNMNGLRRVKDDIKTYQVG
jgi:hypothetical protein